jgi:Carboxypeptidase regulatory-like domain/TonB-dependent Receptor Plug Domain
MLRPTSTRSANRQTGAVALVLALFTLLVCSSLVGQVTSGSIFGSVRDASGAMVPNAKVTAQSSLIGVTRTVTSAQSGDFVIPNLPPSTYTLVVEAQGFKKLQSSGFVLSAADKLNAGDLALQVGGSEASVEVTADAAQIQLQSNSGERSDLISGKQLNDVAMNGRNVLDYMKLIPGIVSSFDGHASGTGGNDAFNINGTRANQHEFTIDGASNVDTGNNGGTHVTINTDAIAEVKILTSNYQAEFGKAAGGQVVLTTRGGSNEFHGNGRFFHRHEGLNANDWFAKQDDTPIPIYRYNYAGYQIGGPIKKDKLFFFWGQEYYRQFVPVGGLTQFYTPTALERNGDFSQSKDGVGNPIQISGPGIVNNKIDRSLLPAAQQAVFDEVQKVLNLLPLPNVSGNNNYNFSGTYSAKQPRREDILRLDYQLNSSNRLFGRWIHNSDNTQAPFTPFPGPFGIFACASSVNFTGGCTQKHPGWNLSVNLVSTITPTLLNELSVGPSHTVSIAEGVGGNISVGATGINIPLLLPVSPEQSIPDFSFGDIDGVNFAGGYLGATPWYQKNTTINANDNLTWVKGSHTLKGGVFYQRNRKDQISWGNVNGQFSFNKAPTAGAGSCPANTTCGDPIASALLGDYQSFEQDTTRPTGKFRYNQLEFYLQDTWRVNSRLTLDYGMRFSWIPPQYDDANQIALFDPAAYDPANAVEIDPGGNIIAGSGNPLNGMVYTNKGQLPAGGWNDRGIMPEPRIGFAFDMSGDHKTILRGGGGMMHDRTQGNLIFNTVFNNPALVLAPSFSGGNIADIPSLSATPTSAGVIGDGKVLGADRNGQVPTIYSFSLGIQHELFSGTTLDVAYVGTLGRHLVTSRNINAIPYGAAFLKENQDPACFGGVVPNVEPDLPAMYSEAGFNFTGVCALGRSSYSNAPLVPYKGYGQIPYLEFSGTSNYNSLQTSLQRRFARGLTFGVAYTWSKSLTTADTDQDTMDTFLPLNDYRAAGWDRTHVFSANYVYDLPSLTKHFNGPKWLAAITDNFQISGVTQFMTGTPINLNNGFNFESGAIDGSNMWGAKPYYYQLDASGNIVVPKVGAPARGSRDTLRTGGMQNWDMSIFKNIKLGASESRYIQLRLEAFNAFNHPNFNNKHYDVHVDSFPNQYNAKTDPIVFSKPDNWGTYSSQYSGVGGPRVVQLGAKIYF